MDTIKYKYTTLVCHAYVFCYGIQPHLKQLAVHHLYTSKLSVLKRLLTCFEINIVGLMNCRCILQKEMPSLGVCILTSVIQAVLASGG